MEEELKKLRHDMLRMNGINQSLTRGLQAQQKMIEQDMNRYEKVERLIEASEALLRSQLRSKMPSDKDIQEMAAVISDLTGTNEFDALISN